MVARKKSEQDLLARLKFLLAGLLVGLLAGIGGVLFFQNYNPKDDEGVAATTVFERMVERNELVSVSLDYSLVEKTTDINRLFDVIDIPFTDNSFWYRYAGTLKAGVDLGSAEISTQENVITISLHDPYVISNTPDMEKTGVLEERNNIFNPIHVEDIDALQRACVEKSQEEAIAGGLLEEARANAEEDIRNTFFAALGDSYSVEFEWQGEDAAAEGDATDEG